MSWAKFNFTNEFQDMLLACVIRMPLEFWTYTDIIRPEYFNGVDAFETAFALDLYIRKYGKYPNFSTLCNLLYTKFERTNSDKASELVDYVIKLTELDFADWEGVRDLVIKFAKERALFTALKKIHTAEMEGRLEDVDPVTEVEAALAVGEDNRKGGINLKRDYEDVIRRVSQPTYGVPTGYVEFDRIWRSGWAPGWLIVPLAPPKSLKTTFAINLGLKMLAPGSTGDVIYYACEISDDLAMMRALYNLTGMSSETIMTDGVEKFIIAAGKGIKKEIGAGNFYFKYFPSKCASINDIEQHAKYLIAHEKIKPKAIFVDYAETIRPTVTGKNVPDWRQQADIYVNARAMGSKLGCCVIMPDRCNKETVGRKVPNMASFQGSFEKAGVVDIAIGLCFTEGERLQNRIRYFVFLNRHGPQLLHFEGRVDPELMRMTVDRQIDYEPEDEAETTAKQSGKSGGKSRRAKMSQSLREAIESENK